MLDMYSTLQAGTCVPQVSAQVSAQLDSDLPAMYSSSDTWL